MAVQAGLANARTALEFALAKVPKLDAKRIYVAGHSSAATLALLFASHEPRIKACAAWEGPSWCCRPSPLRVVRPAVPPRRKPRTRMSPAAQIWSPLRWKPNIE